jgi:tetratricopeptide (TPR) repeat protein
MRIAVTVLALCLTCGAARADVTEAKKHYERGMKSYNLQSFSDALREFKIAYVELPDAAFLFNIAQCQRQLGQYEAAGKSYRAYLNQSPTAPNRAEAERLAKQMDDTARAPHPAVVPPIAPTIASPAREPTQPATPGPIARTPKERSKLLPMEIAGIVTADVGLALVGTGIAFAVVSKQAGDDAYHPASGMYSHAADERQTGFRNGDIVCFVIGGAAIAVGTTIWMLGRKRREKQNATPVVSANAAGVRF